MNSKSEEPQKIKCLFGEFDRPGNFKPLVPLSECEEEILEPIIEDLLYAKTYCVAHGAKESYKSWFAAYVAVCVASGIDCFRKKVVKPGNVVYVYGEGAMPKRLKMLCRGLKIEFPKTLFPYKLRTDLTKKEADHDLYLHIPEGTVLIIFDNYEKYWSSSIEEEVVANAANFLQGMKEYASVILIQHHPKNTSSNKTSHKNAIGSVRIINPADSTYELRLKEGSATCEIYHRESEKPTNIKFGLKKFSEDELILENQKEITTLSARNSRQNDCFSEVAGVLRGAMPKTTSFSKSEIYEKFLKGKGISGLSTQAFYEMVPKLEEVVITKLENGNYELKGEILPKASEK